MSPAWPQEWNEDFPAARTMVAIEGEGECLHYTLNAQQYLAGYFKTPISLCACERMDNNYWVEVLAI